MFLRFGMPERLWEFAPSAEADAASLSRRVRWIIRECPPTVKH
jgi:hypothetical protein